MGQFRKLLIISVFLLSYCSEPIIYKGKLNLEQNMKANEEHEACYSKWRAAYIMATISCESLPHGEEYSSCHREAMRLIISGPCTCTYCM